MIIQDIVKQILYDKPQIYHLPLEHSYQVIKELRSSGFDILIDLCGNDFLDREKRFEVVYNLMNIRSNSRIILKVSLSINQEISTISDLYFSAAWYEREAFDMYGISFNNLKDHRRILTDYGFVGHPMRKDFPVTGYVQIKYDESLQKIVSEPVDLEQEYREFDFSSSWKGIEPNLPGDEKASKS